MYRRGDTREMSLAQAVLVLLYYGGIGTLLGGYLLDK